MNVCLHHATVACGCVTVVLFCKEFHIRWCLSAAALVFTRIFLIPTPSAEANETQHTSEALVGYGGGNCDYSLLYFL